MIDVSQWRASIGLWNGCQHSGDSGGSHGAVARKKPVNASVASMEAFLHLLSLRHKGINNVPSVIVISQELT